jgi:cytochrome c5
MDHFSVVIGLLVTIAVVLALAAVTIGSPIQRAGVDENRVYQEQVSERLRPFGRVVLTGEDTPSGQAAVVAAPAPVAAPLSGPQVFNQACNACHGPGVNGAPRLGDKADWATRLAQGEATVKKHALEGFQGAKGVMPAKGGFVDLSDEEVIAAVEYMLNESR